METIRQPASAQEWVLVREFRQKYFFKSNEDPYIWTFDHPDHIHFLYSSTGEIIGYAHLQLWPKKQAALRIIVIDEAHQNRGFGAHFLHLCEQWLSQRGYTKLLVQSRKTAYPFYSRQGYTEMPFEDPEGHETHPDDIEIGKDLA